MIFNIQKFNPEIKDLKRLARERELTLTGSRQSRVKDQILNSIATPSLNQFEPEIIHRTIALRLFRYSLASVTGLALIGTSVAWAANYSKPGDILFPIKKTSEQIQIHFAPTQQVKINLQTEFAVRRAQELLEIQKASTSAAPAPGRKSEPKTDNQPFPRPINRAEVQAQVEVHDALQNLKQTQAELKQHGDSKSAEGIDEGIKQIENVLNRTTDEGSEHPSRDGAPRGNEF